MMKLRATGIQDLLVVALEDGTIEFYIAPAQLLLRFQVDVGRTVRSIDVELHGERPTLAIIYNEPLVTLYALELTQNGRHLIGNQAENATSLSDDSVRFASSPGLPYSLKVAPVAGIRFSAAPTAITMTRTSKRSVVSVGTDDGGIAFFSLNGSELHKMETRSMIRAMASHRHLLAFTNGSNTVLVPLSRGQDPPLITCPGSTGEVTSIAFDPVHGDLVYAGTSIGEVLVYSFRDSTPSMLENGEREACTLVARALTKKPSFSSRVAPLKLYALKGYVITSGAAELVVFNVSRGLNGGVQIESTCSLQSAGSATISPSSNDRFLPLAVSEGSSVINVAYAAVMTPTTGESAITVFQSLLPSKSSERTDGSWISFLYIVLRPSPVAKSICSFKSLGSIEKSET
uniref:Anaphase-promoting complex subunit 4 WD40 domain-containing protein n=1 Tax=Globisporangium ultimum (strain ATCC 200006 / CBS 805.95 / DAOM BR144) TaxID=431595 RepID=K3W7L8_GLOUD